MDKINNAFIHEYEIPLLFHKSQKTLEVCIILDEFILDCFKNFRIFSVESDTIFFGENLSYVYEEGEILETKVQQGGCQGIIIPDTKVIDLIENEIVLYISFSKNGCLVLDDDCGKMFEIKSLISFKKKEIDPLMFNSKYILEVFRKHPNEFCKVHMDDNFPICFEIDNIKYFISMID